MFVRKLEYENFRNLEKGSFSPCSEINVIYGDNAQGKTNLSEAVWMFTGQKSFRGNKDIQLINKDNSNLPARLSVDFYSQGREQSAKLEILKGRHAVLNEVQLKSAAELSKSYSAIVFSPAEMQLINEGPNIRRKFLNNAISIMRPKYESVLNSYARAVQQRNAILKDVRFHSELSVMLDSFEERIAKSGVYIINQRKKYIEALLNYISDIYSGISDNKEKLTLCYKISGLSDDEEINEEKLLKMLYDSRKDDVFTGITSVGPHRDDMELFINGDLIKIFGSQGQRRSAVLSLKLSEAEILKKFSNEQPVTILDDVMSELDRSRQDYILNHIKGWQVFITCCDPSAVENLKAGSSFLVQNGKITQTGGE